MLLLVKPCGGILLSAWMNLPSIKTRDISPGKRPWEKNHSGGRRRRMEGREEGGREVVPFTFTEVIKGWTRTSFSDNKFCKCLSCFWERKFICTFWTSFANEPTAGLITTRFHCFSLVVWSIVCFVVVSRSTYWSLVQLIFLLVF